VEYLEIREAESLAVTTEVTPSSRVFAAVGLGTTRLIDNMLIAGD
jgi:pantothenate synthetase